MIVDWGDGDGDGDGDDENDAVDADEASRNRRGAGSGGRRRNSGDVGNEQPQPHAQQQVQQHAQQQVQQHRFPVAGEYGSGTDDDDDVHEMDIDVGHRHSHQQPPGSGGGGGSGVSGVDDDAINAFLDDSVTAVTSHQQLHEHPSGGVGHDSMMGADVDEDGAELYGGEGEEEEEEEEAMMMMMRQEQSEKRRAIQAIMRDRTLTEPEKRVRIQQVMDGRVAVAIGGGGGCDAGEASSSMATTAPATGEPIGTGAATSEAPVAANPVAAAAAPPRCHHYERQCNVVAPCCDRVVGCRICHDDATDDHGPLDRFTIREVVCKACGQRQSSKTNTCIKCQITFGEYHCQTCNLWMTSSTKPFHCDACGICRVGGRENYVHCESCCMCLSTSVYANHKCIKEKFKNNCPVCQENLFNSRQAPQDLPCGHAIHLHCFRTLASFDYRCPVCKKTIVSQTTMASAWSAREREIAVQPMPPDLVRVVSIICNDCGDRSEDRLWHFLGVQCPRCGSFNTVVDQMGDTAGGDGGDGGGATDMNEGGQSQN